MQEKQNIGSLFDHIAGSYDRLNHLLSFNIDKSWRRKAVRGMSPHHHILDVAIGTADLCIEMLRQEKAQQITGIDLSQEMMTIGKQKVTQLSTTFANHPVEFVLGSALEMPFNNEQFDAVTCAYGVRNFSDLDKGLKEMHRVLKNHGELMILEFSYPTNRLIAWCYDLYFSHIMPKIGRRISHDQTAYSYLNRSVKHFIWGEEMCEHIRSAGFNEVTFQPLTFGITTIYRAKSTKHEMA